LGATTPEERAFCEWYDRIAYRGAGAVVDLGSWLGSTTVPLARGMTHRSRDLPKTRIQAYDRFVWEEWMTEFAHASGVDPPYLPGDDFRPMLEAALGSYLSTVDVLTADLRTERWGGGPIELLVVDAMKSWELAKNIVQEFYSRLVHGGVIFHQDFAHYYTPWIHLIGYRLRDCLEVYYDVPHSDAVAFRLRRPFEASQTEDLASPGAYDAEEVTAAFNYSRSLTHPGKHANITAAEAMFYVHGGELDRGAAVLDRSRRLGWAGDQTAVERLIREARRETAGRPGVE
jgi:hypothetical protein